MNVEVEFSDKRIMTMVRLYYSVRIFWTDVRGQDLIEYSLLAGFIAVVVAGFLPPTVMPAISTIFSKVVSGLNAS
jgi:Flp pilus assembly pilin Flp